MNHALRHSSNPLYACWCGIRQRCRDSNHRDYIWYGAKGITVCPEWEEFNTFVADMLPTWQPGLTIERKDTSLNYCKDNCTWATRTEQNRNRSNVKNYWKQRDKILELRATGLSQREIGQQLNISQPPSVSDILTGRTGEFK